MQQGEGVLKHEKEEEKQEIAIAKDGGEMRTFRDCRGSSGSARECGQEGRSSKAGRRRRRRRRNHRRDDLAKKMLARRDGDEIEI